MGEYGIEAGVEGVVEMEVAISADDGGAAVGAVGGTQQMPQDTIIQRPVSPQPGTSKSGAVTPTGPTSGSGKKNKKSELCEVMEERNLTFRAISTSLSTADPQPELPAHMLHEVWCYVLVAMVEELQREEGEDFILYVQALAIAASRGNWVAPRAEVLAHKRAEDND